MGGARSRGATNRPGVHCIGPSVKSKSNTWPRETTTASLVKREGKQLRSYSHECPCGFASDPVRECVCSPSAASRYIKRISGPLLDRVDLFVEVSRVEYEKLIEKSDAETSSSVRERIEASRVAQKRRFEGTGAITNSEMGPVEAWNFCQVDDSAKSLLQAAMKQMHLSARGFHCILKVSRTISTWRAPRPSPRPIHCPTSALRRSRGFAMPLQPNPTW